MGITHSHFNCTECGKNKFNVILDKDTSFKNAKITRIFCCNCGLGVDNIEAKQ